MGMPSWISEMFPDLFGNGGPKPKPNGEFVEFTNQSSRTSMKQGRGSMEEKLNRGQTTYRDGAPTPGGTSTSLDDQTRNLDTRGTGQGVNFFGYGNTTKKNPFLDGKRANSLNITTNPNSIGQVEIGGFTTLSAPMMESDYGKGDTKSASDNSFYRNKMDITKYGDQYKALGDPDIIRLTLGGEIPNRTDPRPAAVNGDPLGSVPRKLPNFETQESGRGKGGGDAWLSKYYFDGNENLYSPVGDIKGLYPAQGNVESNKYLTRLKNMTNSSLQNLVVSDLGGPQINPDGEIVNVSEKRRITQVVMSGDLPLHRGGGTSAKNLQIEHSSISNASPLLVGKTWDGVAPENNKNFNESLSADQSIYDPILPAGEGRGIEKFNGKDENIPSDKAVTAKVLTRLGMDLDTRRKNPYHFSHNNLPGTPEESDSPENSNENSLPRSKQISYVDGVGKSSDTNRLEESLNKFDKDYSTRLRSIGELQATEDLSVQNDIKNLVDLKNFADSSIERRTKEAPNLGETNKTYGQRFYENPFHLNKKNIPNYNGTSNRKDTFNIKGVLDASDHSLSAEPDFASEDFIPLYFHDLVNKKYIPFRAMIQSIADQSDAQWEAQKYLGRADQVHVYTGFTRTMSIDVQVVALSVEELHPMWQRINYMVGLTKPAKYTQHDFIVPPFVRFNLGDIYRNQPVLVTSVSAEIPSEVSWELVNNEKNNGAIKRDNYEYANGDIKRKQVKVARYPTSCILKVSMTVLEKFTPETKQNHFGNSPLHIGSTSEGGSSFNENLAKYDSTSSEPAPSTEEQNSRNRSLAEQAEEQLQRTAQERSNSLSPSSRRNTLLNVANGGSIF